ncbi:MAG: PIG-L family deacetylase [Acidobacteria bacterium]|nr:PIG-L family deacetylase [Acidobacteriota bacterium]
MVGRRHHGQAQVTRLRDWCSRRDAWRDGNARTVEGRAIEAEEAAKILGLDVRDNLGLPDGHVFVTDVERTAMVRALRRLKPRVILTHQSGDTHPDHDHIATLVRECSRLVAMRNYDPESADEKIPPPIVAHHIFREAYCRRSLSISQIFSRRRWTRSALIVRSSSTRIRLNPRRC